MLSNNRLCYVIALASATCITGLADAQDQGGSLDDWMNRTTGKEYSKDDRTAAPKAASRPTTAPPSVAMTRTPDRTRDGWGDTDVSLLLGAGVNIAMDADFKNQNLLYSSGGSNFSEGFNGVKVKMDAGLNLDLGIGFSLSERWRLEFVTGAALNTIGGMQGAYYLDNLTTGGTELYTIQDASGYLLQLPAMMNIRYAFDINDRARFGVFAGVGGQFSHIDFDSISVQQVVNGGAPSVGSLPLDIDSSAWSFRYQFGVDASWQISSRAWLGIYARYSATTEANLRDVGLAKIEIDSFQNVAIGANVTLTF